MSKDKVLLLLGASSDIGIGLIEAVHQDYDYIIAHYHRENDKLMAWKENLQDKLIMQQADFAEEQDTVRFISKIQDLPFEPTDIVHLCSPFAEQNRFHKMSWDSFQEMINTSLRSLVQILQAFLPGMSKRKGGRVVVMLTAYTLNVPPKFLSSYVTVKYALLGLVKALAAEYANKKICINGVSPEMIETKFLANTAELIVQSSAESNPMGRNLVVEDVIPTIQYLLSDASTFVTGQNIAITGGK